MSLYIQDLLAQLEQAKQTIAKLTMENGALQEENRLMKQALEEVRQEYEAIQEETDMIKHIVQYAQKMMQKESKNGFNT